MPDLLPMLGWILAVAGFAWGSSVDSKRKQAKQLHDNLLYALQTTGVPWDMPDGKRGWARLVITESQPK